ncbi:MAG: DICT sensory domain-containing protein [Halanaeroarchaeum sp.]
MPTEEMLSDIIDRVEGTKRTLTLYNVDVEDAALRAIASYFEPQLVTLRRASTDDGLPRNFAVLHDGEAFVAAEDVVTLARYLVGSNAIHRHRPDELAYPEILEHVDDSTFSEYGRREMIIASREVEKRAWRRRTGTLHAGFQRLSIAATQRETYRRLAETPLDVHVYGQPDHDLGDASPVTIHASRREEIGASWFVVYDGDGDESEKVALLAREAGEDAFVGFWTYDPALVDEILQYLASTYPA